MTEPEPITLLCPKCRQTRLTILDIEEPKGTVTVEQLCAHCLTADNFIEPVFRDKDGNQLF
jgi:hypothetical protein